MSEIRYEVEPAVSADSLNELFSNAWVHDAPRSSETVLRRSLTFVCALKGTRLVGFVNVAWDGGLHGFILDTTVHREFQRQGIGTELLRIAADIAKERGIEWLHVDFESQLKPFYRRCGYNDTAAGLLNLCTKNEAA